MKPFATRLKPFPTSPKFRQMMRTKIALVVFSAGVFAFAGCSDVTTPAPAPTGSPRTAQASVSEVSSIEANLERVARAAGVALESAGARFAVRDALRDSPWNEHKVTFQEFLASEGGTPFLAAAAAAAGETPERFRRRADALPLLDFYIPSKEQRRTWSGTDGVVVEASLNFEDGPVYRFGQGGSPIAEEAATGAGAVMLLHPMELRAARLEPQAAGVGDVVQSASDGQEAYTLRWVGADGSVFTPEPAQLAAAASGRFSGGGGASSSTSFIGDGTRLGCISINAWDDSGNNEVVLKVRFYEPDGRLRGYAEWSYTEFEPNTTRCPGTELLADVLPDGEHNGGKGRIDVDVWEDDCGCFGNDDDHIGERDFFYYDNDQTRDVPVTPLIHDWRATMDLEWTPRDSSTHTTTWVSNVVVYENTGTTASARALDQYGYGLPGYSVSSWWIADAWVASVNSSGWVTGNSMGTTTLYATMSGLTGDATVTVKCNPEVKICPE